MRYQTLDNAPIRKISLALILGAFVFSGNAFAYHEELRAAINENKENIESNDDDIAANKENIESNDDDIAANKENIESNDDDIAANKENIESNDDDIAANKMVIEANAGDIMANSSLIMDNSGRIDSNLGMIQDNARGIAANTMAIADLDDRLMEVDDRVSKVAAMGAALSAVPNVVPGDSDFFFGVGVGSAGGSSGLAVGVSGRFGENNNVVFNAGAATSSGETSARVGLGFCF